MNLDNLKSLLPQTVLTELPCVMETFEINTQLRLAHFLAQCAHESGNFKRTTENLNYSAERLLEVFPKKFTEFMAHDYAHHPVSIASYIYADRYGNGAVYTQDGWLFRGRSYVQLTFRDNYASFDKYCDDNIMANPDLVATKYPLLASGWYWNSRKLNDIADLDDLNYISSKCCKGRLYEKLNDIDEVKVITKKVNGGTHGLEDRRTFFTKYYQALQ